MDRRTGAARTLLCAALLCCAGTLRGQDAAAGEKQYTLHFSGCLEGTVTVRRDSAGKVTVTPKLSGEGDYAITPALCPLIPEWAEDYIRVDEDLKEAVIEGNTITDTDSNGDGGKLVADDDWEKTVVDGNTTTFTRSDGYWLKSVVDGNTTTDTYSDGWWHKTVVNGNTTTDTYSNGRWRKTVVDGNTTTFTDSNGRWEKTVADGNTTTTTDAQGYKEVVEKRGYDIFIHMELRQADER